MLVVRVRREELFLLILLFALPVISAAAGDFDHQDAGGGDIYSMMEPVGRGAAGGEDLEEHEEDPCAKKLCPAGRECHLEQDTMKARCVCVQDCGTEVDPRRMVCSNHNETYPSECALHRARCLCQEGDPRCPGEEEEADRLRHAHVDYYGECRPIPSCDPDELEDFPRRMREWLANVMQEMRDRGEIRGDLGGDEESDEDDPRSGWRLAAVWRWCSLDSSPHDRAVSRHELFPVRAPLRALEHCIGDFLDSCDQDQDHRITIKEWGQCLELGEEELEAECEKLDLVKEEEEEDKEDEVEEDEIY